jgi:hypothetical protein
MDNYILRKSFTFIFLIGILICILYIFNPKDIINLLSTKEHLVNLYKPNKVFYHDDKIYLMDTHHLFNEENPKIFNRFEEFQKYILDLEDKHLIKLPLDKNKIVKGVNKIKPLEYDKKLSIGGNELIEYEPSRICTKRESLCDSENFTEEINKFKKENCNKSNLNMENCEKIDVMIEKQDELNERCFVNRENSRECRKFNKYRWDLDLLKNFCVKYKTDNSYNNCLLGEYYKENLLGF